MAARAAPYALLLLEVLIFFRHVLFGAGWIIPYDLPGYHLPLATYAAASLGQGRLPLWDNFTYCGFPFYANVQTQLFYPGAWPFFLLGNALGLDTMRDLLEWQVALHVWLGGVLTYRLLRNLDCGAASAALGATSFQLGGFFASQAQHLGVICTGAWLPLLWANAIRGRVGGIALGAALSYLAGYPAAAAAAWGSTAIVGLAARTRVARLAAGFGLGLLLIAAPLAPALELASWSGAAVRGQFTATGGGVPWAGLVSLFWPNYYRLFDQSAYGLPWNPTYLYLYSGLLPLALCLLARGRWVKPILAAGAVFLLWMLGESTPLWRVAYSWLPVAVRGLLLPELAMMAFLLCIALLAGLGASRLESRLVWIAVLIAAADLTHQGSGRWWNTGRVADTPAVSATQFEGSAATLQGVRERLYQTLPPARIDVADDSMAWAAAAPLLGVPTATGNDPLCLRRIKAVRLGLAEGAPWLHYYPVTRPLSPILDLLNVRYLVAWEQSHAADALPQAAMLPGHQLRENADALPRFFLVGETLAASGQEQAVTMLRDPEFRPAEYAIVEGAAPMRTGAKGSVEVTEYGSRRASMRVTADREAFLVSSETYYPGWRAWIDGRPAPLVLTNVAFRGLAVPAGTHVVTMRFEPWIFWYALPLSALAWIGLAVIWRRS